MIWTQLDQSGQNDITDMRYVKWSDKYKVSRWMGSLCSPGSKVLGAQQQLQAFPLSSAARLLAARELRFLLRPAVARGCCRPARADCSMDVVGAEAAVAEACCPRGGLSQCLTHVPCSLVVCTCREVELNRGTTLQVASRIVRPPPLEGRACVQLARGSRGSS